MSAGTVWFVGAGPGAPDLITVRGRDRVAAAGAVLYAGSLVPPGVLDWAPAGCELADSKGMTLEAIQAWLIERARRHETVVRLQPGDPALYGALAELARPLDEAGIPVAVVPGVTSAMAAAASAGESLTLPEGPQSVIFTRVEGRTPMPEGEQLADLARHGASLCIYLSITLLERLAEELRSAGWADEAPVVVVHRASWPGEERILRTRVGTLAADCRAAGLRRQTMILVSPSLGARQAGPQPRSRLYDPAFTHGYRRAGGAAARSDPDD
ncbi:precorrin-4 C(11)-methyltransferase [Halorhodospira neutriphila]|uniref:Precorrin-4 C(11)-methyltransferase n=1 Tax=Halorhodospira neutriphila TaxID=168379 RepID=A0ABS1E7Q8_9GAMM|nr:precorrin-4 C(11)-methyltransferase [Halorhodospira neutriphila]